METLVTEKVSIVLPRAGRLLTFPAEGANQMDVKDRILTKAAELFMRYGIRSITMDEIAAQLGISKKTVYQVVTDKDDMVYAVIEQEIRKNEHECLQYRYDSNDSVHEIFLAVEDLEEMLRYTNPMMLYDLEKYHPRAFQKI